MTDDAMVEKVARAMATEQYRLLSARGIKFQSDPDWEPFGSMARAAIAATGVEEMREKLQWAVDQLSLNPSNPGMTIDMVHTVLEDFLLLHTTREEPK